MLERIKFENFTNFDELAIPFSPGINIFIGENGTGKTHVLKAAYAACDITKTKRSFAEKINNVFYPKDKQIGRLVKRTQASAAGSLEVIRKIDQKSIGIKLSLTSHNIRPEQAVLSGSTKTWLEKPIEAVYIPVKDMLANAPGFASLFEKREIHFEEIYVDIIRNALIPFLKGPTDRERKRILEILQKTMKGKVVIKGEEFFLRNEQGELEFTLLAEGYRKLGLLWVLLQNGTLLDGSALFWDEPESNLNPSLLQSIIEILIEMQRMGVQIFIATHDYVLLKEFDLQQKPGDKICFHSLYRDQEGRIRASSTANYLEINPNAIDNTFGGLIDREITKSMGRLGKK
jgi:energy-coupling factor transporter ATP-binding protein EcfA2